MLHKAKVQVTNKHTGVVSLKTVKGNTRDDYAKAIEKLTRRYDVKVLRLVLK